MMKKIVSSDINIAPPLFLAEFKEKIEFLRYMVQFFEEYIAPPASLEAE
jgi:hypothetical protein